MKIYSLKRELEIYKSIDIVFSFFEKPENLSRITPSNLNFNIITPTPIEMKIGTLIDYTINLIGFKMHWRTIITSYNPPFSFVDEQLKGPYKYWHHKHEFESTEKGTIIRDYVNYALPFGILGRLAYNVYVGVQLRDIFDYRASIIISIFENNEQ